MQTISLIFNSAVIMYIFAIIFLYIGIRFAIRLKDKTNVYKKILCAVLFLALAFYCWYRGDSMIGKNAIDSFVYDIWFELKQFFGFVKTKL
jgi:positive regulator of sigma E activity